MKDSWIRNKGRKFGFKSRLLLGLMALAVTVGFGTAVQVVPNNMTPESPLSETDILNPFTLSFTVPVTEAGEDAGMLTLDTAKTQPQIRIPYRPALRSPIRPPLVNR